MWQCDNVASCHYFSSDLNCYCDSLQSEVLTKDRTSEEREDYNFLSPKKQLFSFSLLFVFCSLCHLMETFLRFLLLGTDDYSF